MTSTPRAHLPPRLLPVLYFGAAHVALALAFGAIALDPRGVSGFFYHFWTEDYGGMAWSAAAVGAGIMIVGVRVVRRLGTALPRAVRAHIVLAFVNVFGAGTLGVLLGFDKVYHFLPGFVLANVFAHAHLAAIGWASMMVVGVAYRLLPMVLPAAMPDGPTLWTSAVLLQAGVTGLFVTLLFRSSMAWIFALTVVAGFAAFISQVVWMLRRPRPRPPGLQKPDPAVLHAGAALASLGIASALGVWLANAEPSPATLRIAMACRRLPEASRSMPFRSSALPPGACSLPLCSTRRQCSGFCATRF